MEKNKIKILFFHFDLGVGGAEKVLVNLVNNLPKDKYDITVKLLFRHGVRLNDLAPHIRLEHVFDMKPVRGITRYLQLFSPEFLYKHIIKEKYDIEIAYIEGIPARIISGSTNSDSRKFAWIHSDNLRNLKSCFRSIKETHSCYSRFNKIAFVSETARNHFIDYLKWNLETGTIHNVVDTDDIQNKATEEIRVVPDSSVINLCIVGRLHTAKSHERLLAALSRLHQKKWHLYIIGDGELRPQIESQIKRLNLCDNISIIGFVPNPYKYMARMDAVVCSSLYEGFSTVAVESMVLGIPFISTQCAGMREILEDGESGLIVSNDVDGLYKGLERFVSDSRLRQLLAEGAKERGKHFSIKKGIQNFETFINA